MRAANVLVFDEYMTASTPYYTDQSLNEKLGTFDMLAIMAVVDDVGTSTAGFYVDVEHSADGRTWLSKNGLYMSTTNPAAPAIGGAPTSYITTAAGAQTGYFGYDDGTKPSLGLIRFKINAGSGCHVRIFVTGRNWGR